ncbi:MAG: hypothetical protein WC352_07860 [Candidatus Omnitrophota bacterium]|jgi:hypothetical protein
MNEHSNPNDPSDLPADETQEESFEDASLLALVKKIQQHLVFLERKIDTLIQQSGQRPAPREDRFTKPRRPFGHHRPDGRPSFTPGHGTGHPRAARPGQGGFPKHREAGKNRFFERKKRFFHPE